MKSSVDPTALVCAGQKEFVTSIVEEGILEVNVVSAFLQEVSPTVQMIVKLPKTAGGGLFGSGKSTKTELGDE